jgi:glutamate synthase (NADPH) small chain
VGAGPRVSRSMKAYLGIRDPALPYRPEGADTLFGIAAHERNFARVQLA